MMNTKRKKTITTSHAHSEAKPNPTFPRPMGGIFRLAMCTHCGCGSDDFLKCVHCKQKISPNPSIVVLRLTATVIQPSVATKSDSQVLRPVVNKKTVTSKFMISPPERKNTAKREHRLSLNRSKSVLTKTKTGKLSRLNKKISSQELIPNVTGTTTDSESIPLSILSPVKDVVSLQSSEIVLASENAIETTHIIPNTVAQKDLAVVECRSIRIGDYKCLSRNLDSELFKVEFSDKGILFEIPHAEYKDTNVKCALNSKSISNIKIHFRPRLPIVFVSTELTYAAWIRKRLGLGDDPTKSNYFCPFDGGQSQKYITFLVESFSKLDITTMNLIYGSSVELLDYWKARELLLQITPDFFEHFDLQDRKPNDNVQTIGYKMNSSPKSFPSTSQVIKTKRKSEHPKSLSKIKLRFLRY